MINMKDGKVKVIAILFLSFIGLATVMLIQLTRLNYYDKIWGCLGLGGQCIGMISWFYGFTTLSILADNILYTCVGLSIFLLNKALLIYALLTLVVIYVLFFYHKVCILTNAEWPLITRILTPIFIVILSCKVLFYT